MTLFARIAFTLLVLPTVGQSQLPGDSARRLVVGSTIERSLKGGGIHRYHVELAADDFAKVVVMQKGVDVVVRLYGPRGDSLELVDSPNGTDGPEPLAWVSDRPGAYRLDVLALDSSAAEGRYTIQLEAQRAASATDRERIQGDREMAAGTSALQGGNRASFELALRHYMAAAEARETSHDTSGTMRALSAVGDMQFRLNQFKNALASFERDMALARTLGDEREQVWILFMMGISNAGLNEIQLGIESLENAIELARRTANKAMEGSAASALAGLYGDRGQWERASELHERAISIARELGDKDREASALNNAGRLYQSHGEMDRALDRYLRALQLTRETKRRSGEMSVLSNLGSTYAYLDDNDQALAYRLRALEIARELGNRNAEATLLNNVSISYEQLGDVAKAIDFLRRSLAQATVVGERAVQARANENLGRLLSDKDSSRELALQHLENALVLWRQIGDVLGEAATLGSLADLQAILHRNTDAWSTYSQALALMRRSQQRTYEARTLQSMAVLAERENDLGKARAFAEQGLALVEAMRREIGDRHLRTAYLAMAQSAYATLANVLMRSHSVDVAAGYDRRALEVVERSRARSLLDGLADENVVLGAGIAPALLERERQAGARVDSIAAVGTRARVGNRAAVEIDKTAADLEAAQRDHFAASLAIRAVNPSYATLTGEPLGVADIQRLLDSSSALLVYAGGATFTSLWLVTHQSLHGYTLAGTDSLASDIRRYVRLVTERNRRDVGESTTKWRARITAARRELLPLATRLSERLLGPVARDLKTSRILIVSSGALQYFPFAALPLPRGAVGAGMPLVSRHEVAVLPSVSTVAALRELRSGRPAPSLTVAVIADPVFARNDSRVVRTVRVASESASSTNSAGWRVVTRGLESPGTLPRLLNTRKEALAIQSLVPAARRAVSLDFAASTATALHPSLAQYRIVHFATHAFVNSDSPEFSGIALSMVDERGASRDGYVRLSQIYNMKLSADLVVLSACQTALGKDVKGEGLIGLTRAFLFAGATAVVASLWKVDDEATAELMKRFYSGMLGPTQLRPVAALRAAQVSLARETRWRDPYYWAGFVLQGDWQ